MGLDASKPKRASPRWPRDANDERPRHNPNTPPGQPTKRRTRDRALARAPAARGAQRWHNGAPGAQAASAWHPRRPAHHVPRDGTEQRPSAAQDSARKSDARCRGDNNGRWPARRVWAPGANPPSSSTSGQGAPRAPALTPSSEHLPLIIGFRKKRLVTGVDIKMLRKHNFSKTKSFVRLIVSAETIFAPNLSLLVVVDIPQFKH